MINRGPASAASGFGSGFGSIFGSTFGSLARFVAVVVEVRLDVVRAGGLGFGSGSVAAGSSVLAVSTGVSVGFGTVVGVRRGVGVVGRRVRAVRGDGLAGVVAAGVSVTTGLGDSTG